MRRPHWPDRTTFTPVIMPLVRASQRRFGYATQADSIRAAKFVYRVGGWFWRSFHSVHGLEFAMMAEDLDPIHFPHWAETLNDATAICPVCGGWTQPPLDGWFAVATTEREGH